MQIAAQTTTNVGQTTRVLHAHHGYEDFAALVRERIAANQGPLFTTDATGLFESYLDGLPAEERQGYNCNSCRRFIETYGGLVTVDEAGLASSLLWLDGNWPAFFLDSVAKMCKVVRKARVTGVFLTTETTWGQPVTGAWKHLSGVVGASSKSQWKKGAALTAAQAMAEKKEEFGSLSRGLAEYPVEYVRVAVALLESDALYRSEKVLGPARFLLNLHESRDSVKSKTAKENLTWRAVATAAPGFCHPKTTMVNTLLDDIAAGVDGETTKRKFAEKMNPTKYQRPVAPPSSGQIQAAEKLAETLNLGPALRRRFARVEEVDAIWRPVVIPPQPQKGGVFGHLLESGASGKVMQMDAGRVTWRNFVEKALPGAEKLAVSVPTHGGFIAILTAADPEARPIMQWDSEEKPNPFSHYVYHGGSSAAQWKLQGGTWVEVTAVTLMPHQWFGGDYSHHNKGAVLVLKGAVDTRDCGLSLFPETLKAELHGVRSVIEAYSARGKLEGREEASVCGLDVRQASQVRPITIKVTSRGVETTYHIDRME